MKTRLAAICFLLSCVCPGPAQTALVSPSHATPDEIFRWLRSGDPRLVAWGASFAAQTHDAAMAPELAQLAEGWQPLPIRQYDGSGNYIPRTPEQVERANAMQAVLDALIQLHGTVTAGAIRALTDDFTGQILTLFALMPEPARAQLATSIYATRAEPEPDPRLSPSTANILRVYAHRQTLHLAAALLAQHPPPGFMASLLNETTLLLTVTVSDAEGAHTGIAGGMCGDSFSLPPAAGWPQLYTWVVEQTWTPGNLNGGLMLVPGTPAITSRRALTSSSCSTLPGFSSEVRLRLTAKAAGMAPAKLGFGTSQYDNLLYSGGAGFEARLAALVARHTQQFRPLISSLLAKGLLTPEEAASAQPTFRVYIDDDRLDRSSALPVPHSSDPKLIFEKGRNDATPWAFSALY